MRKRDINPSFRDTAFSSLNFIRLLRVVITPSEEIQAKLLDVSRGLFSALLPVTFRKSLLLYSFCDVRINICVSVTFVYFILNPTVNLSSDKSSGLSPPFSLSLFLCFRRHFLQLAKIKVLKRDWLA